MKILISCLYFHSLTGSELYYYELSKQLVKLGHDVSILSQIKEGTLHRKASNNKVKVFDFTQAPKTKFDIILASHKAVINGLFDNNIYPDTPIISINHSEVVEQEFPIIDSRINHYVAIRPSIRTMMEERYFIDPEKISLIYNPINEHKFSHIKYVKPVRKTVLFIGTIDHLRKAMLLDLVKRSRDESFELIVVGEKHAEYLDAAGITIHPPTWDVEKFYSRATHTAGIMLGRTTIEGWFYGLPGYIYQINKAGDLQSMEIVDAPKDMSIFSSQTVAKQIADLCLSVLEKIKVA